jgi:hypothetical protein
VVEYSRIKWIGYATRVWEKEMLKCVGGKTKEDALLEDLGIDGKW